MHKSIIVSIIFILFASCEKKETDSSLKTAAVLSEIMQTESGSKEKSFSEKRNELRTKIFNYTSDKTCIGDVQCRTVKIGRCWDLTEPQCYLIYSIYRISEPHLQQMSSEYNSLFGTDPLPIIFYPPAAFCISGNCTSPEYLNLLRQLKYNDQMRSCTSSASCKSQELSVRNCKNPKSYLIYSTEAADELKIQEQAALYERIFANSYNEEALKDYSISCSASGTPPVLSCSAGICSMQ